MNLAKLKEMAAPHFIKKTHITDQGNRVGSCGLDSYGSG
jgi:hypothetical protein